MSSFAYLSVLISVVVGLGLAHLLTSAARLIQHRRTLQMYVPTLIWMATLFLFQIQIWWVAFQSRSALEWNYFSFLLALLMPVIAYVLCYLLLPEPNLERADLRTTYHANRAWFFGLLAGAVLLSFVDDIFAKGHIPLGANTAFRLVFLCLAVAAIRIRRDSFHLANAVAGLGLFSSYILVLFFHLK